MHLELEASMKKARRSLLPAPISRNQALPQQLDFIHKSFQKVARINPSKGTPLPEAPQRLIGNDRPLRIIEIIGRQGRPRAKQKHTRILPASLDVLQEMSLELEAPMAQRPEELAAGDEF